MAARQCCIKEARSTCWCLVLMSGLMLVVLLVVAVAVVIAGGPPAKNPDKDRCVLFKKHLSTKMFRKDPQHT